MEIAIMIVWIDMLSGDHATTASAAAKMFQGERVVQLHDPNKLIGKAIAESIGANNAIAWDMYLFFERGCEWKEQLPSPLTWAHQLDDPWASPDHYAWGNDLPVRLREIMNNLIES